MSQQDLDLEEDKPEDIIAQVETMLKTEAASNDTMKKDTKKKATKELDLNSEVVTPSQPKGPTAANQPAAKGGSTSTPTKGGASTAASTPASKGSAGVSPGPKTGGQVADPSGKASGNQEGGNIEDDDEDLMFAEKALDQDIAAIRRKTLAISAG